MFPMNLVEFLLWMSIFLCSGCIIGMSIVMVLDIPVNKAMDNLLKTINEYFNNKF